MYSVSCIIFNECLYFSRYVAGDLPDGPPPWALCPPGDPADPVRDGSNPEAVRTVLPRSRPAGVREALLGDNKLPLETTERVFSAFQMHTVFPISKDDSCPK